MNDFRLYQEYILPVQFVVFQVTFLNGMLTEGKLGFPVTLSFKIRQLTATTEPNNGIISLKLAFIFPDRQWILLDPIPTILPFQLVKNIHLII